MAETVMVRIAMQPGPYRRVLGEYEWSEKNGFVIDVDVATAANLLTYPGGGYWLAERPRAAVVKALADAIGVKAENLVLPEGEAAASRPLAHVVGGKWALQLTEHGIHRPEQLAALDEAGIEQLAMASGASADEVRAWVQQANE